MGKKMYVIFCVFLSFKLYAATITVETPEITIDDKVIVTGNNNLNPFSPCDGLPAVITCANDAMNLEVTLSYPLTVSVSNVAMGQVIDFSIQTNPIIMKEFNSFIIKKGGIPATFPESISSDQIIVFIIEMKLDYFGLESLAEYNQFLRYEIDTN